MRSKSLLIAAFFAAFAHVPYANAAQIIPEGALMAAPKGFEEMCERQPDLCANPPMPSSVIDARAARELVERVNAQVNRAVARRSDIDVYGQQEYWTRPDPKRMLGDCEDIAIEKRFRLVASGFPADHLRYAVVYSHDYGLHTVLVARLGDEDLVLDSMTAQIRPWSKTGYSWLEVQSGADQRVWRAVGKPLGL